MKKVIRLTESDLVRIVKRVIRESEDEVYDEYNDLIGHYDVGPDRLDSARFIPNQKGTEKGYSMGPKTPERSYRKPRPDSGMERSRPIQMKSRRNDFDLNENDSSKKRYESTLWKKYNFLPDPDGLTRRQFNQMSPEDQETFRLEHLINKYNLNKVIKILITLYGDEDRVDYYLSRFKPLGITSLDELEEYKGGYPEDEY